MEFLEQDEPPYIFHVRSPLYIRAIGLLPVAMVFSMFAFLCQKFGARGTGAILFSIDDFASWFFRLTVVGALAFSMWVIFPPQSTLARFEFTRERIRFIPNFVARSIGEPFQEAVISHQSTEIILCYRIWPGLLRGYRIIVRAANGAESELAGHSPHTQVNLNAAEVGAITHAVLPATGLPVRVVIRRKLPNGTIEEVPEMPPASKTDAKIGIVAAVSALPLPVGIFMGWLYPTPAIIIAVGLTLWFCVMLTIYLVGRNRSPRKNFPVLYALTTLVTLGTVYAVGVVVTAYLRGRL